MCKQGFTYWIRQPEQAAVCTGLGDGESASESCSDSPEDTPSVSGRSSVDVEVDASSLGR